MVSPGHVIHMEGDDIDRTAGQQMPGTRHKRPEGREEEVSGDRGSVHFHKTDPRTQPQEGKRA